MKGLVKRVFASSMCMLLLAFTLIGCGNAAVPTAGNEAPVAGNESQAPAESANAESEAVGDESAATESSEGKVFRIASWNDEFQQYFDAFYKDKLAAKGIETVYVITPNEGNGYQNKLDADLLNQANASADEKIDLFIIEADYATKYTGSPYALDVKKDIGITDADLANQYKYTQDIATDANGNLKGVAWQATPGLFVYRRSIAKDVLGTDDPDTVQAALSDWTKFEEVAKKASAKGYKMLSGYDDSYRTFQNNATSPWVVDDKVVIDPQIKAWVDQTKDFTDKKYNNKTTLWSPEWSKDQGPSGKVFGFFYSTWGIRFTLRDNAIETPTSEGGKYEVGNGIFGDYAACQGPASYFWGGCWICGATGSDNISTIRDVMYDFTCNEEFMVNIVDFADEYMNNIPLMDKYASDPDYGSEFLGGQNHYALFNAAAAKIAPAGLTDYDQGCNESFQGAMVDYFEGNVDYDTALKNFYSSVTAKYPNLSY